MKHIYATLVLALMGVYNAMAYDTATAGTVYYGSSCAAYGLSDGTVAISTYYLSDGQTEVTFPATIEVWENGAMTAEYEVSTVGYSGWDFWFDKSGSSGLTSITSIVIPEGVTTINGNFWGATALTYLELPSTLTEISKGYAFEGATALTKIVCYATTAPTLATNVFAWSVIENKTCTVAVPDGAAEAYNEATWSYWTGFYAANLVHELSYPSITTAGYSTYYNQYGYVMPEGVEGYIINWTYDGSANLVKVYDAGDEVYAGLALVWKSTETLTETTWYTVEALASGGNTATWPEDEEGNAYITVLNGSQTAATTTYWGEESSDYYYYKLSYNSNGENLGWYWGSETGDAFTSAAHKVWLFVAKNSDARSFISMSDEGETGISSPVVTSPAEEGLRDGKYLENGGIVVVKDGVKYNVNGQRK